MQLRTACIFSLGRHADYNLFPYENSIQAIVVTLCDFSLKPSMHDVPRFQMAFFPSLIFL